MKKGYLIVLGFLLLNVYSSKASDTLSIQNLMDSLNARKIQFTLDDIDLSYRGLLGRNTEGAVPIYDQGNYSVFYFVETSTAKDTIYGLSTGTSLLIRTRNSSESLVLNFTRSHTIFKREGEFQLTFRMNKVLIQPMFQLFSAELLKIKDVKMFYIINRRSRSRSVFNDTCGRKF